MNYYLLISFVIGFYFMYMINYLPNLNNNTKQKIILYLDDKKYHIHHWLTLSILLIFFILGKYLKNNVFFEIILGILLGLIVEGLLFEDRFSFIVED